MNLSMNMMNLTRTQGWKLIHVCKCLRLYYVEKNHTEIMFSNNRKYVRWATVMCARNNAFSLYLNWKYEEIHLKGTFSNYRKKTFQTRFYKLQYIKV